MLPFTVGANAFRASKIWGTLRKIHLRQLSTTPRKESKISWDALPTEIQKSARALEHARAQNYQIQPLSKSLPDLDQRQGYQIAAAVSSLRQKADGEAVVGRKIGFTNRGIWPEYGIDASNWSYMYNTTTFDLAHYNEGEHAAAVDITRFSQLEPRIEPEIVLGVAKEISSSMSDKEILHCIKWIAHGFEIVVSIFPDWKFTAADTTAAFALHGQLIIGPKLPIQDLTPKAVEELLEQLSSFGISLYRNDELADTGKGSNVLGSPVKALRHLVELLEQDEFNDGLSPGEIVTTGTLTRALPVHHGDSWSTKLTGIDLPGISVKFKLQ